MSINAAASTKVVTGRVRLSYVHIWEPYSIPNQDAKYSVVLLIPKTDRATIKKLRDAQQAALEAGRERAFGGRIPTTWKDTIHDGDEEADLDRNPEYAGHLYMSVGSQTKPGVVDKDVNPVLDQTAVYSGCYARVSLKAFPYSQSGNKGVSFGLNHVQLLDDGEALDGRSKAADDFDRMDDDEDSLI